MLWANTFGSLRTTTHFMFISTESAYCCLFQYIWNILAHLNNTAIMLASLTSCQLVTIHPAEAQDLSDPFMMWIYSCIGRMSRSLSQRNQLLTIWGGFHHAHVNTVKSHPRLQPSPTDLTLCLITSLAKMKRSQKQRPKWKSSG